MSSNSLCGKNLVHWLKVERPLWSGLSTNLQKIVISWPVEEASELVNQSNVLPPPPSLHQMISFIIWKLQALSDCFQVTAIGQRQAESCQGRVWTAGARQHNTELGLRLSVVEKADALLAAIFATSVWWRIPISSPPNMCWILLMWQLDTLIWREGKIDRLKNQLEFNLIKGRHGGGK